MAPHDATAWVMLAGLLLYTLLGGADFGAGVHDLLARGPRRREQQQRIADAIGPIWEANHVWLILVVVLLFTGFPRAFAAWMTALHVPVTLVLLGIVARGSTFVFRHYAPREDEERRRRYGAVFAWASVATPVLLGVVLGTGASGALEWNDDGVYVSGFFAPWLRPFPWAVGLFTLSIFAFLAAVYLCVEVEDEDLREDFRRRALLSAVAVGATALLAWVLARDGAPQLAVDLAKSRWTWPLQIATGGAAVATLLALWMRRFRLARACAVLQVTGIVLGYGLAMSPYVLVPSLTIADAAAPETTHVLLLWALGLGALVLFPSLFALFRVFKGRRAFGVLDED